MAKRQGFTVTNEHSKEVKQHYLDTEFKPELWETMKSLNWIVSHFDGCEPALMAVQLGYQEEKEQSQLMIGKLIPFILQYFVENQFDPAGVSQATLKSVLFLLANHWYFYAGGPKPLAPKPIRHKGVSDHELFLSSLSCPMCNKQFVPKNKNADRQVLLNQFGEWMARHAKTGCQKKLSEQQTMRKVRKEQKEAELKDRKSTDYYLKLQQMGSAGSEIVQYLMSLRQEVDRMESLIREQAAMTTDKSYFATRFAQVIARLEERKLSEDKLSLSIEDKIVLGGYYIERRDISEKILAGGNKTQLKKLNAELNKVEKMISALEKKGATKFSLHAEPVTEVVVETAPVKVEPAQPVTLERKLTQIEKAEVDTLRRRLMMFNTAIAKSTDIEVRTKLELSRDQLEKKLEFYLGPDKAE